MSPALHHYCRIGSPQTVWREKDSTSLLHLIPSYTGSKKIPCRSRVVMLWDTSTVVLWNNQNYLNIKDKKMGSTNEWNTSVHKISLFCLRQRYTKHRLVVWRVVWLHQKTKVFIAAQEEWTWRRIEKAVVERWKSCNKRLNFLQEGNHHHSCEAWKNCNLDFNFLHTSVMIGFRKLQKWSDSHSPISMSGRCDGEFQMVFDHLTSTLVGAHWCL